MTRGVGSLLTTQWVCEVPAYSPSLGSYPLPGLAVVFSGRPDGAGTQGVVSGWNARGLAGACQTEYDMESVNLGASIQRGLIEMARMTARTWGQIRRVSRNEAVQKRIAAIVEEALEEDVEETLEKIIERIKEQTQVIDEQTQVLTELKAEIRRDREERNRQYSRNRS